MEKVLLKRAAVQSVALMLGVIMLSFAIRHYDAVAILARDNEDVIYDDKISDQITIIPQISEGADIKKDMRESEAPSLVFTGANVDVSNDILDRLGERYLVIRKPQGEGLQIHLEDLYINKELRLIISGFIDEAPDVNFIGRANGKDAFIGEAKYLEIEIIEQEEDNAIPTISRDYGYDPLREIVITEQLDDLSQNIYDIILRLDSVYVHILYEDDNYYYIDLKKPKEVYDRILVVDAGHGGKDPGAISKDGLTYEKEINLKILSELKKHLDRDNVKVYYTKTHDETLFLRPRVNLANELDCDFFISIHCNSSNNTGPNGTEIYYYNHEYRHIKTKDMAKIFSDEISKVIPLKNNGLFQVKDDDIFILNNARVPAVIIEVGYMSNLKDLEYLKSKTGHTEIAKGIYNSILRAYEELVP